MNYKKHLKEGIKVFKITKTSEGVLEVPPLGIHHKYNFDQGLYEWVYKKDVIKDGLFGEGVKSNACTRFGTYRTVGKHLIQYLQNEKGKNGSFVPMKTLNEKFEIGESVDVIFYEIKNPIQIINGAKYKIDLADLEDQAKQSHKTTLWLK